MRFRFIAIVLISFLYLGLKAQPDETIYLGSIAKSGYADNVSYGPFNIGFNFTFYENTYSEFYVSSNGLVTFGIGSNDATVDPIPTAATPNNYIAPFWDDLVIDPFGNILYSTVGVAPNRKLIIQFRNMSFYTSPTYLGTFYVILYETSNIIQIQYRMIVLKDNDRAKGATATIGIENSTGSMGIEYAYQDPTAVTSSKAISFTPSGISYSTDDNATYDGVYLTTNLTLPEPGLSDLLTPAESAVVGINNTFEWSASTNATTYALQISTNPDLIGATTYNAGSGLSYYVAGLIPDNTYYWTVFTSNATGFTWNEVKSFTTSSSPPLAAVPQTVWIEQAQEEIIKLKYTGGDASTKTAIITSLPGQGELYQYNAGVKGDLISPGSPDVTDPERNVIYVASGGTGNGVGNFNYKMHDDTGDSPEVLITINVSPPGIPNVLYVSKSTTNVDVQFDIAMADPSGKQSEFTVIANGSTVTLNSASLKTGDPNTIVLASSTTLVAPVTVSYTQGTITSAMGGVLLTFTNQPVTLTSQTITFTQDLAKKFSDSPFTLIASAPGGAMTYSSSNPGVTTIVGSSATFHALGSSNINARQAGNTTYAPAKYIRTLTVAIGDQTISFTTPPAKTYGDADFAPGATASSGLTVAYSSDNSAVATIVSGMIHIVGAGTATITASQAGNTLWNPATDVPRTLTVNKATATVTLGNLSTTYNGSAQPATATTNPAGLTVGFTYDGSAAIPVNAASYAVVGTINDVNYQGSNSGTLVIDKASLTATADDKSKMFGDVNPALTVTYTGFAGTDDLSVLDVPATVATVALQSSDVGSYPITVSGGSDNNYTYSYTAGTLTIDKASLTVTADDKTKTYGDVNPSLTITYSGFLGTDNVSVLDVLPMVATTALPESDAGTYSITASGGSDNNYSFAYVDGTLTIDKASATVTPDNLTVTYNGYPQTASATTIPDGLTVDFTYNGSATFPVNADTYTVVGTINDINYQGTNTGTLVITKAPLTATADDKSKMYGDVNPALTVTYTGLAVTDIPDELDVLPIASTEALQNSDIGEYPITVSGGSDNNYTFSYVEGTLTINKADQTITFENLPFKTYGDADFSPGASASSGLSISYTSDNTSVATIEGDLIHTTGAGVAEITASQAGDENYNAATDEMQLLIVSKASLTYTADDQTRDYLAENPALTYTVSGFVNEDTESVINVLPATTTTADQNSPAGSYPITVSGGSDNNYRLVYKPGTLTVNQTGQTITFTSLPDRLLIETPYTLVATSTSGLTVLFESQDNAIATISGDQLTGVSKGTVEIRAYHPGDNNYTSAEASDIVEFYSTHKDIMHLFTPNNDGINDYWELPELATWGKSDVRVYNRWGKLVFSDPDYNNLWDGISNGSPLPEGPYYFIIKTENSGMIKGTLNIVR